MDDLSEWAPCEVYGHQFLNHNGDPAADGEWGVCKDCGWWNGEDDDGTEVVE